MNRKKLVAFFLLFFLPITISWAREVELLDKKWLFINQDVHNAEQIETDVTRWEHVTVPHDWAISKPFDLNQDIQWVEVKEDGEKQPQLRTGRTGALPMFGVGWYRKELNIIPADRGKRVSVEFDGAMSLAKIYVNGQYVGERPYGYTSFSFDITDKINIGGKNILAVRLENKPESSRWYSGAGIYRNVRLVKTNQTHVPQWGTYITTPEVTSKRATVLVKTQVNVPTDVVLGRERITLVTQVMKDEKVVATSSSTFKPQDKNSIEQKITLVKPQLWSPEERALYTSVSKLYVGKTLTDQYTTTFGVRTIHYDKDKGFFLNGKKYKMNGVCMHHDLGPLGVAVNYRALQRQLEILKEMGCNAIRTSHNPPTPELLQLTDEMGFFVQVEAFDEWRAKKNKNGYGNYFDQWAEKDLCNLIHRDRNHPSVVMWSTGNEIREQTQKEGGEVARLLTTICHREDPTRPVTAGFNLHNDAIRNGLADAIDLVGFNYKPSDYAAKRKQYPHYIIYGSETASTVSSRGEYKFPVHEKWDNWSKDYHVSSYDLEYPFWGSMPDKEFAAQDDNESIFGEFVWTGFDYLGEPTPYNEGTPARSSYFGIVDLAGLKKDRYYLYQSRWSTHPVLHLLPHWNWPDRDGKSVPVFCYTNYAKAELFVNGVSQGIKSLQPKNDNPLLRYRLMWTDVVYKSGEIKVVAYNNEGKPVDEKIINTAGDPHAIRLTADRTQIAKDGKDLSFVTVEVVDRDGNLCPRANNLLFFETSKAGALKALCNGDPTDQTSFVSNYMRLFNGKMVAIVTAREGELGDITLSVSGLGFNKESITIAE